VYFSTGLDGLHAPLEYLHFLVLSRRSRTECPPCYDWRVDSRSPERVRYHYEVERELSDRLRGASTEDRSQVYGEVYDELFHRVEDHPQLAIGLAEREGQARSKLRFVARFLTKASSLMEVGAGDCVFSRLAAPLVRHAIAVDVSRVITTEMDGVANFELIISDGTNLPMESASVDVAFSDQLMEHLHPDDAAAQLREIARVLRPGGKYVCITPNRVTGPHDVSRSFDDHATGFHLREYSAHDLRRLFLDSGFAAVEFYAGGKGRYVRLPNSVAAISEVVFAKLPKQLRLRARDSMVAYALYGLNAVGTVA
jgi:SAM-dependent methyltransferase